MKKLILALFLAISSCTFEPVFAQTSSFQSETAGRFRAGATLPTTACRPGDVFYKTTTTAGAYLNGATGSCVWAIFGGSGGVGAGTVTSVAAGTGMTFSTITTSGTVTCNTASGTVQGCLSAADWVTFNTNRSDLSGAPFLVSGGQVVWTSAYAFRVSAAVYYISGVRYTSTEQTITLTAAHATLDRIDVIAVDTTGTVVKIDGTAASQPSEPATDPSTQLKLTIVTVAANTSAPVGTSSTSLYAENAGASAEWNWTTSGSGFDTNSTSNPRTGSKDIEGTTVSSGAYAQGEKGTGSVDPNSYSLLVMYVRSKSNWAGNRTLQISMLSSGVLKGTAVTLKSGTFGFDSSSTSGYQQIAIPIGQFAITGGATINQVRIADAGGSIGFYIDDVSLQAGGVVILNGGSQGTVTSITASSPLTGGTITNTGTIGCTTATTSASGCLTSTDWTTFNNKAPAAQPYDIVFTLSGKPGASATLPWVVFTRTVTFSANWSGAYCKDLTNATSSATMTVKKNGSTVGTVVFNTDGTCTFATSGGTTVVPVAGDYFTFVTPAQDATLSDIMVTIPGVR